MSKASSVTTVVNDVAVASGGGTTTTSSRDLSSALRTAYHLWIENDPSNGPSTTVGQVTVESSPDNNSLHFAQYGAALKGSASANTDRSWTITIPPEVKYVRFLYGGNVGGGDVTYRIIETKVTSF